MSAIVLQVMLEASVRALAIALLVGAVLAALRVRASEVRHAAWTIVACVMLVLPLRSFVPLDVPIDVPLNVTLPFAPATLGAPSLPVDVDATARRAVHPAGALTNDAKPTFGASEARTTTETIARVPADAWSWSDQALLVYALGVACAGAWFWLGWRAAARLARHGRLVGDAELEAVGVRRADGIVIRESAVVAAPVTIGVLTPTILLPTGWRAWPNETARAVLAHELAHVERRDPLWLLIPRVNRCLFWFHPLAWWLVRAVGALAEHASDAAAVRTIGGRHRYAAILIEMAHAVRDRGGRVSWQAIGIGGRARTRHLLERRVDRVLVSDPVPAPSPARRRSVVATCVVAIAVAVACRPESAVRRFETTDAIVQRDRALRRTLRAIEAQNYRDFSRRDWDDTSRIPDLEAAVARDPDDLDAVRDLLVAYWAQPPSIETRRAPILRVIERHPDADLAGSIEAHLFPRDLEASFPGDAVGYEQAKARWLAHLDRPDVGVAVLSNAASFFEAIDRPLAESILLRAQAQDRQGPWSARLGHFYASVLTGMRAPSAKNRLRVLTAAEPRTPYGIAVRKKLGESTDEVLLTAAGWSLARSGREPWVQFDAAWWSESCLTRALRLNPQAVLAHTELLRVRSERERGRGEPLWSAPPLLQYQTVAAVPEPERFTRLPRLARQSFTAIGDIARWDDPNLKERLDLARQQARQYAEDALTLAPKYRQHPDYGTAIYMANMTLGGLALRDGDTTKAVQFMLRAAAAPASEELAYADDVVSGFRWRLAADLLERGEREAVLRFVSRMAYVNLAHRGELREAAAAIRRGEKPRL